jgi:IS30 family transposase
MSELPLKYSNGRLTPAGVEELHKLRHEGLSYDAIAKRLGVHTGTVYGTATGKTNKDLHPSVHAYGWAASS